MCLAILFTGLLVLVCKANDKPFIARIDRGYRYSHICLGGYDIVVDSNFTLRVWESYSAASTTTVLAVWALLLPWIINLFAMATILRHEKVCCRANDVIRSKLVSHATTNVSYGLTSTRNRWWIIASSSSW